MRPKRTPTPQPPRRVAWLLTWLAAPHLREELEGDLTELFHRRAARVGYPKARFLYLLDVLRLLHPRLWRRKASITRPVFSASTDDSPPFFMHPVMLRSYFKTAWRQYAKNKVYSFINTAGLATGMAVTIMIGLWVWDELSFDQSVKNHARIAQVWQFVTFDIEKSSYGVVPVPLAGELRSKYPDFESVSLSTFARDAVLASGDTRFTRTGCYVEPDFLKMMSVRLAAGSARALDDVNSILLSRSTARALFGAANPVDRLIRLNNRTDVRVTGVFEDFPDNSSFRDVLYLAPWNLLLATNEGARNARDQWDENSYRVFVQLKVGSGFGPVSAKIRDIRMKRDNPPPYKPEFFLHPMDRWHLYSDFKNGVNTGGLITFVRLFGVIGGFVLLLACVNFMNLSTARSEKRAKEVGIRKAVGSLRGQLIGQFVSESLLVTGLAFGLGLGLVRLLLPVFNEIADKKIGMPWQNPWFWALGFSFTVLTGLIAASYPALYLSSFRPVRVLKGTFRAGRRAAVPRQVLVVFQFAVSVTLIIGTIIVLRQIEFARNRPVGYSRNGLIEVRMSTPELYGHYDALRADLLNTGAVAGMSESMGSITEDFGGTTDVGWPGKTPEMHPLLMANKVTHDFGTTIGWQLVAGRDFSRRFTTDSSAMVLNEAAVKLMGLTRPLGTVIRAGGKEYRVIGIIRDIVKETPFEPVKPSIFTLDYRSVSVINLRLAPRLAAGEALDRVAEVFGKYNPAVPFEYKFVDDEYAKKFSHERRIGQLASGFAVLAIFISCLGLFGLASFMAEQRTKEIGVRKVLGASVFSLWRLLSRDFVILVVTGFAIAAPVAWYFLENWLRNYTYRTPISWWIFAVAGLGALLLTLLTVSFQGVKAALMNPVKSLRSE
ncbi:ABC transporter permease [Larkinella soli]|uniref:ABC transporter permease n=1 Tax=Larkinella soli TaxID=1770527 RepID=UPI0013E32427|nr:ABC transporter permease [Larkinella soli]